MHALSPGRAPTYADKLTAALTIRDSPPLRLTSCLWGCALAGRVSIVARPYPAGFRCDVMAVARKLPVAQVTCRALGFSTRTSIVGRQPDLAADWDAAHLINAAYDIHGDDPAFGFRGSSPASYKNAA